ncbi:MAG: DUF4829 domain-containing protein [Clostridium sp.]
MKSKKFTLLLLFSFIFTLAACGNSDAASSDYSLEFKNGDRFFKSEVKPSSKAEEVVLDFFKIEINDDFNNLKNLLINTDYFNTLPQIYKENFNDGLYTKEVIITNLDELSEKEFSDIDNVTKYYPSIDELTNKDFNDFKIIEVHYTNKLTEKYDEIAQFSSGDWTRYFVLIMEKEDSPWKIYDIYGHC